MIDKLEVEKIIIVTKDNFQSSLQTFRKLLQEKLFEYVILNNDISTTNPNLQDKEGEIVFSEFTLCKAVNYQSKDIGYKLNCFLIPSIKFHRYAADEIASFSSTFLKYLTNEKSLYDFNLINSANSISYANIYKRKEYENSVNLIIKDGKPFKKENKTSYYYYPKAFELPSKKYQKKYEELLKYFIEQNFDENAKKIFSEDKSTFQYESDRYVSDFKFLNSFLDFKWGQIFEKIDSDTFKIFVDEYKINFNQNEIKFNKTFITLMKEIKNSLENDETINNFQLEINPEDENELGGDFFKNWKQYIIAEDSIAEFSYEYTDKNKMKFILKADKTKEKKEKLQNLIKFLTVIISIPKEINNKKEFCIKQIFFRRINMRNLFPNGMLKNLVFYYHLTSRVDPNKFTLEKDKSIYLSKVGYKKLFVNNKNEEEILFGYKLEPQMRQLLEVRDDKRAENIIGVENTKTISLEFGKDLEILQNDEKFHKILDGYFSKFVLEEKNEQNAKFRTVIYKLLKIPNFKDPKDKQLKEDFESLLERAKEIKKNYLLDEEIGVTYFYDAIFKKKNINIYGTNLKNKIYFPIKHLLLESNNNNEEEVKKILQKVNIYDISYIALKKNIDFYQKYLRLKKNEEMKERTVTLRMAYVIEETEEFKNRENLEELKNKFYVDEKDKIAQKHYVCVEKNKFYDKAREIAEIFTKKYGTDFTVNKNAADNNVFELNIIDPGKYGEIENISKEIKTL
jgi:hypothetical protein